MNLIRKFLIASSFLSVIVFPIAARAEYTYTMLKLELKDIDKASFNKTLSSDSEIILRDAAKAKYEKSLKDDQSKTKVSYTITDGLINDTYGQGDLGKTISVGYRFFDLATGLPIESPIDISYVKYRALLTPEASDFVDIGTASNAASDYSVPFVLQGFEPIIEAVAYDTSGNAYLSDGYVGINMLVMTVPESDSVVLLLSGLAAFAICFLKKRQSVVIG